MRQGFFPKAARVVSRKTTQLQLIQAGFGIALLPESMQDIAPANIHFLPLADPDCRSTIALAYRQHPTPLVEQFVQHFSSTVGAGLCGSGLARESGGAVDGPFAGKPAPTGE
jgi:DNA-binding transcriptional LysR family regulator